MKYIIITGLMSMVACTALCQSTTATFAASLTDADRMEVVKTNIPLTEWHERSFWPRYQTYAEKMQSISLQAYISLQDLARTNKTTSDQEAFETAHKMIASRFDELSVMRQFFDETIRENNGNIAFQFLQTELMLDMAENVRIYGNTHVGSFRFQPNGLSTTQFRKAKYNTISNALSLSPAEAAVFLPVYTRYEMECEEVLGEEYNLYELFAGEATGFTPGLAKQQGLDLLVLMEREMKLKEKYFNEMNYTVGTSLAARFLAWEDYYSTTCKLATWIDAR